MPSLVTAKTIQAYEPFLREIADRVGNDPFFAQDLRAQGVAVPGSPDYVPAKFRAGGKRSVENCFGCHEEITNVTPRGTRIRACARSGRWCQTLQCPK